MRKSLPVDNTQDWAKNRAASRFESRRRNFDIMKWLSLAISVLCALSLNAQDVNKNPNKKEPPMLGPHWSRDVGHSNNAGSNPDMSYHGGPVLPSATIKAIWWGSSWPTYTGD